MMGDIYETKKVLEIGIIWITERVEEIVETVIDTIMITAETLLVIVIIIVVTGQEDEEVIIMIAEETLHGDLETDTKEGEMIEETPGDMIVETEIIRTEEPTAIEIIGTTTLQGKFFLQLIFSFSIK